MRERSLADEKKYESWVREDLPELIGLRFHDWASGETEDRGQFEAPEVGVVEVLHDTVCGVVPDAVVSYR